MPWDELLPDLISLIEKKTMLRNDEILAGLVIGDSGIEVKITRKRGRKTNEVGVDKT